MTIRTHYLAAAAAIGALAVPAAAQTAYPYGNQQPAYPQTEPGVGYRLRILDAPKASTA